VIVASHFVVYFDVGQIAYFSNECFSPILFATFIKPANATIMIDLCGLNFD